MIDLRTAFPAVEFGGKQYAEPLQLLSGVAASGVYVILSGHNREPLYVGESHTGRLYDTITRHFRRWSIDARRDAQGRRRGGTTYNRLAVFVAFCICEPSEAPAIQYAEIQRLQPRDNVNTGASTEVPF